MSLVIIVEHDNQHMHASTAQVLSAALMLGSEVTLCVIGYECLQVAEEAGTLKGVSEVILADNVCYKHHLAENISHLVVSLAHSFKAILMSATTFGKDVLPRIAALLDVTQISDVTSIVNQDTFEHPIYAGNVIETVQVLDETKVLTIRATAFDAVTEKQTQSLIKKIDAAFDARDTTFNGHHLSVSVRPELTHAKCVVSGGRGLQSAENFKLIETLADALGAAVGASRAAVDAGFVSNDYQVGQTGKIVAPALYIAIGISGAVQHLAGMKDSKVIVAINKDADAPIFQVANYGLVGDLFVLVPEFIEQLKNRS
jgi:electron transfer flavoprotein alpha subunit